MLDLLTPFLIHMSLQLLVISTSYRVNAEKGPFLRPFLNFQRQPYNIMRVDDVILASLLPYLD